MNLEIAQCCAPINKELKKANQLELHHNKQKGKIRLANPIYNDLLNLYITQYYI